MLKGGLCLINWCYAEVQRPPRAVFHYLPTIPSPTPRRCVFTRRARNERDVWILQILKSCKSDSDNFPHSALPYVPQNWRARIFISAWKSMHLIWVLANWMWRCRTGNRMGVCRVGLSGGRLSVISFRGIKKVGGLFGYLKSCYIFAGVNFSTWTYMPHIG